MTKTNKLPPTDELEVEHLMLPITTLSTSYLIRFSKPIEFVLDSDPIKVFAKNKEDHEKVFTKEILNRFHEVLDSAIVFGEGEEEKESVKYLKKLKEIKKIKLIPMKLVREQ